MDPSLQVRLLGTFDIVVDGRPVEMNGSKRDVFLAMLALRRGHPVSVDALIDGLWGDDVPASPRNAVQHHVTRLRTALGHPAIVGTRNGYALVSGTTDVLLFEETLAEARAAARRGDPGAAADAAARALALWRGPALHGLSETRWVEAEADRLEELRVDALEEWFAARLELGEHREIVSDLRLAVEDRPFRERLWGLLMLALYRSGRQADALEAYGAARRIYVERLGLEPSPELRGVQEAILAQDPRIAAVPLAAAGATSDDRPAELAGMLENMAETLRRFEDLYARVQRSADGAAPYGRLEPVAA